MSHSLLAAFLAASCASNAAVVINDGFDDGILSPAWTATTSANTTSVSAAESGAVYQVVSLGGPSDEWARHELSRSFHALADFSIMVNLAWDSSANGVSDMIKVGFALLDGGGDTVARMYFNDAWVQQTGGHVATGGRPVETYSPGFGTAALAGSPALAVVRTDGLMDFLWDGIPVLEAVADTRMVESLVLFVEANSYDGFAGTATFSPVSFDSVTLEGSAAAVPEAGSTALCALLLSSSALLRRRPLRQAGV